MCRPASRRHLVQALSTALVLGVGASPAGAAITGVCPDGSIFIVQTADAIPCRGAKRVDPSDIPPIQPEYLPRPYGWEVFNRRSDPNNPYNMVGSQTPGGTGAVGAPPPQDPSGRQASVPPGTAPRPPQAAPEPVRVAAVPPRSAGLDLGLSPREIEDLGEIVALAQAVAPATVAASGDSGERRAAVQLALSSAFQRRVHGALARRGGGAWGPVLLFRADAQAPAEFHGNLTFVQDHVAFHPDPENPAQLGILTGELGRLGPGDRVLGYTVLPVQVDPRRPLDVYWNDRRITATLRP